MRRCYVTGCDRYAGWIYNDPDYGDADSCAEHAGFGEEYICPGARTVTECGVRYAQSETTCERPAGHRADSENVYRDPDGAHQNRGLLWTQRWVDPAPSEEGKRT